MVSSETATTFVSQSSHGVGRCCRSFLLTGKVASPKDTVLSNAPRLCAACCEGTAAAQRSVPPESPKLDQDLVLRERRAHVPCEPGDPRRERERAPTHVGKYDFEAREAARFSAYDELGRGFERLVGYLCVWGVSYSESEGGRHGTGVRRGYLGDGKPERRMWDWC
jgi:hypothetical protein